MSPSRALPSISRIRSNSALSTSKDAAYSRATVCSMFLSSLASVAVVCASRIFDERTLIHPCALHC
eukprot:7453070-Alexandrium_andersonii.AAC.1